MTDCVTTTHQKCCIYSSWSRILKPTNYASQSQVQGSFKKFLTVSNTIFYAVLKVSLDLIDFGVKVNVIENMSLKNTVVVTLE